MTTPKQRLIIVSNRLPVAIKKHGESLRVERSSGGLASALDSAWKHQPGIWIGWPGITHDLEVGQLLSRAAKKRSYELQAVHLNEEEVAKFYSGFANEIIWPLFHDMPSRCNFDPDYWEIYQRVNGKFAEAVSRSARPGDFVWVHDYHLMLAAKALRKMKVQGTLGFFLHIPFPAPDVFEKLPWRQPLIDALLDYDLIGFQADRDRDNFTHCVQRLLPDAKIVTAPPHLLVEHGTRRAVVGTFPISIDFEEFAQAAGRPEVASRASEIRRDLGDKLLVLGVDRLDYTKGIPERLRSFRLLLRNYPDLRGRITLVQVVVPSREDIPRYKDLRTDLELLVSRINGEFTQPGSVPVQYMHRNLGREELLAYYRAADIALITPLKDGMNLVAKEFCAAQVDDRGVLIVSEFAGAGPELRQGALVVNPNDYAVVAAAIYQASTMPDEEKRERMHLLRRIIAENDVRRWAKSFMDAAKLLKQEPAAAQDPVSSGNGSIPADVAKPANVPGLALVARDMTHKVAPAAAHRRAV